MTPVTQNEGQAIADPAGDCLSAIRSAAALIAELREMATDPEAPPDALMAFVETVQDAQHQLSRALHAALSAALSPAGDGEGSTGAV